MMPERKDPPGFVELIERYGRRIAPAALEQQQGAAVSSPLTIWLLLAACASAASGELLSEIEAALGCSAADASQHLKGFLTRPPSALSSAMALWVRAQDHSTALVNWSADLPDEVERGPIPSQSAANEWVDRMTQGMITTFPADVSRGWLWLVSTMAAKVRWQRSFEVGAAAEHLRDTSPWRDRLTRVLLDPYPPGPMMLATTASAGVVATHIAIAVDDLAVLSVAADPSVARPDVVAAAYEMASLLREDRLPSARCSLFDVPIGQGHSWDVTEEKVPTRTAGERSESITQAVLVAWSARGELDLRATELFGVEPALASLFRLVGPHPEGDDALAIQSTAASYSTLGFEAADAAIMGMIVGHTGDPVLPEWGVERHASLYFDHPHAALAINGTSSDFSRARAGHTESFGLPLFSAWVEEPEDADEVASRIQDG